jgi:MFS family permease
MGAAELIPTVIFGPFAGAMADRFNRQRIAIMSQVAACIQAALIALLVWGDMINEWILLVLTLSVGVTYSFGTMARLTIFAMLVERPYLPSAIAINAAIFNLARFLGPAFGGAMIANWGVTIAFALNAVTFLAFIVALARLEIVVNEGGDKHRGLFADMKEGLNYAFRHPGIGPVLFVLMALAFGIKGFPELLPGFVDVVLDRGVQAFAYLTASIGIGAAIAAIWFAQRGRIEGLVVINIVSLIGAGVSITVLGAAGNFWVSLVCVFFAGAFITIVGTATQSLMQYAVEGAIRGRVMSLYGLIFRGGPALSALILGGLAEIIGLRLAFAVTALATVAAGIWLWSMRKPMVAALEIESESSPKTGVP